MTEKVSLPEKGPLRKRDVIESLLDSEVAVISDATGVPVHVSKKYLTLHEKSGYDKERVQEYVIQHKELFLKKCETSLGTLEIELHVVPQGEIFFEEDGIPSVEGQDFIMGLNFSGLINKIKGSPIKTRPFFEDRSPQNLAHEDIIAINSVLKDFLRSIHTIEGIARFRTISAENIIFHFDIASGHVDAFVTDLANNLLDDYGSDS
jgi:hypothetical protein